MHTPFYSFIPPVHKETYDMIGGIVVLKSEIRRSLKIASLDYKLFIFLEIFSRLSKEAFSSASLPFLQYKEHSMISIYS